MITSVTSWPSLTMDIFSRCLRDRSRTSLASRTVMMPVPYVPASGLTMTNGFSLMPYSLYFLRILASSTSTLAASASSPSPSWKFTSLHLAWKGLSIHGSTSIILPNFFTTSS
ncbi:hypothetical protein D3C72_1932290 [compost metagenome]